MRRNCALITLALALSSLVCASSALSTSARPATPTTSINQDSLQSIEFPRTWVPLASTLELDPDRPTPLSFLGQNYVAYRDNNDMWVVLDDACSHRLAPLSEGRVDRALNRLECSYHGWSFNSTGNLQRLPQATQEVEDAAKNSPKSCVKTYPSSTEKNILWFWPWSEDCFSAVGDILALPEGMLDGVQSDPVTTTRDLPYSWDVLVENLIDPSHVPFAHHGMQGKREDAIPINMTNPVPIAKGKDERGFQFEWGDRTMGKKRKGTGAFRAPYVVYYDAMFYEEADPKNFKLTAVCIPTKPGWSRAIIIPGGGSEEKEKDHEEAVSEKKKKKPLASKIFSSLPVWLIHIFSNRFLDTDLAFLHFQERELERREKVGKGYFMPAPADRCISALRRWLPRHTSTLNVVKPLPPAMPKSVLFDRYAQHTEHCRHCQAALKGIQKWRKRTYGLLTLSILSIKLALARLSALGCLAALLVFQKIEQAMKQGGFKHYENH